VGAIEKHSFAYILRIKIRIKETATRAISGGKRLFVNREAEGKGGPAELVTLYSLKERSGRTIKSMGAGGAGGESGTSKTSITRARF